MNKPEVGYLHVELAFDCDHATDNVALRAILL